MHHILADILSYKKREVERAKEQQPPAQLEARVAALPPARDFKVPLQGDRVALIAEVKFKSPSRGMIREDLDLEDVVTAYREAGTEAISVLTDRRFFGGAEHYLRDARRMTEQPLLRKDFIIDPYQIYQSRCLGADAVLLIAKIVPPGKLRQYIQLSRQLGLQVLVECRTEEEIAAALEGGAEIIGINNRDLDTFETDLQATLRLAPALRDQGVVVVSESGIWEREHVMMLSDAGVNGVLVGEALMASADLKGKALSLRGVPALRKAVSL
ncbi:MAG TPA: indole-3-glycerol phosphate synthase TrpC [Clostridia bacterium]|nr:indole-3-glycerol phosphate synthase TrpC [Clostridia bacterium]